MKNLSVWIVAACVVLVDQLSKQWATLALMHDRQITAIPNLLDFVFVRNSHGAYGLFGDKVWFLIALSIAAFGFIFMSFRRRAEDSLFVAAALGAVSGGAIGNIVDRLHYHFVVDFIRIVPLPIFEVFNIADAAISIGIVCIIVASLQRERATRETEAS